MFDRLKEQEFINEIKAEIAVIKSKLDYLIKLSKDKKETKTEPKEKVKQGISQ